MRVWAGDGERLQPRTRTPTVSTSTTSYPAASQRRIESVVFRATPPSVHELGDGRTYALSLRDSSGILVLSPRMDPPVMVEDGSTDCREQQ
jgi:hypothetical protein